MALTPKQQAFVNAYVKSKNATEAAIKSGYSKKTAAKIGSENLQKPDIREAIDKGLNRLAKKTGVTAEMVINRIKHFAFAKGKYHPSISLKAAELLGKHFKIFTDVIQHEGGDAPIVVLTMPANGSEAPTSSTPVNAGSSMSIEKPQTKHAGDGDTGELDSFSNGEGDTDGA